MKTKTLLFVFFLSALYYPQKDEGPYFNGLQGLETREGNTQLYYRLYGKKVTLNFYSENNSVYLLNVKTGSGKLFLEDNAWGMLWGENINCVVDFQFWHNNPDAYIYLGYSGGVEVDYFTKRSDNVRCFLPYRSTAWRLFISEQNDSILYTSGVPSLKSVDGGRSWKPLKNSDIKYILGVSPYNGKELYWYNDYSLYKSIDAGESSYQVDDNGYYRYEIPIVFDKDTNYLYRISYANSRYRLSVSDKRGEPGSWSVKYSSDKLFSVYNDKSKPGSLFLVQGNRIYYSTDYGNTFSVKKAFGKLLTGFYKKPGADIIYAAERYKMYELAGDSVSVIKSLPVPEPLFTYYPLKTGNKWCYQYKALYYPWMDYSGLMTREVTKDTVLANGKTYFKIKKTETGFYNSTSYAYERADFTTGMIYRYYSDSTPQEENAIADLTVVVNDTIPLADFISDGYRRNNYACTYDANNKYKWDLWNYQMNFEQSAFGSGSNGFTLVKDIGIDKIYYANDGGQFSYELNGCVVNGMVYGDTSTIVGVNEVSMRYPLNYELYQNYPNPFNAVTTIRYKLPRRSSVRLTVCNLLGQTIMRLVDEIKPAGNYEIKVDGSNLSSGIYFYKLDCGFYTDARKFILLK